MVATTNIPARMDRMPWFYWHWWIVLALGVSWILDGLQITTIGLVGAALRPESQMDLSSGKVGAIGAVYICGAVCGSLFFGTLADRYGRRRLFLITPAVYLTSTFCTALWPPFSWSFYGLLGCIFVTGFGIGGEYSAINSAINEFIPARVRGLVDLAVNGTYWLGAALGALMGIVFLNDAWVPANIGWRLPFVLGSLLGLCVVVLRVFLPESPRWLMTHGRLDDAEAIVAGVEARCVRARGGRPLDDPEQFVAVAPDRGAGFFEVILTVLRSYKKRAVLGLALMASQAFFYNAIFFTYAETLNIFYGVATDHIGYYMIPFAIGNFLGSVTLGKLFDVVGRKIMICLTYAVSATLLLATGVAFLFNLFDEHGYSQTAAWCVIFFVCSAGASAAYLTISEVFPLEIRALSIAVFYSAGTFLGGVSGPLLFGFLICPNADSVNDDNGNSVVVGCNGHPLSSIGARYTLLIGYAIGAALMYVAAVVEAFFGVNAEGKSLEDVAAVD